LGRYSKKLTIIAQTIKSSMDTMLLLLFLMIISTVLFGTCIFYAEQTGGQYFDASTSTWIRDVDGKPSPFQSIPESFWWAMVTMCRIPGYGDAYPTTALGKVVASLASLMGILVIAFPVAVIGQTFKDQWKEHTDKKQLKKKLKKEAKEQSKRELSNNEALNTTSTIIMR
jgi:hypothetical protein